MYMNKKFDVNSKLYIRCRNTKKISQESLLSASQAGERERIESIESYREKARRHSPQM